MNMFEPASPAGGLTYTQALQFAGLVPCLFLALALVTLARRHPQVIIPTGYFLSLACGFALPLADVAFQPSPAWLEAFLLFGESTLVAFAFLLILQFMSGQVPRAPYWLVLAIPLVGGATLVYASVMGMGAACAVEELCADVRSARTLYNVFGAALVFLLLMHYTSRSQGLDGKDAFRHHKYALVVALILLHLLVLAVDLALLAGHVTQGQTEFIETVLRLSFIYLVITALFRVFYPTLAFQTGLTPAAKAYDPESDKVHYQAVRLLLDNDRVYREMRLNRAALAKKIGIGEHHLSRVINYHFGKNFNEVINSYRIEEAKTRLKNEPTQITVIAFEVGFNSIASFNRVFKEKVGISPTEYRNKAAA